MREQIIYTRPFFPPPKNGLETRLDQIMPVALEQWRAAVGAWNTIIPGKMFRRRNKVSWPNHHRVVPNSVTTRNQKWNIGTSILIMTAFAFYCSKIYHRLETGHHSSGVALFDDNVNECVHSYHVCSVVRSLLIVAGDVELNPGPSKKSFLWSLYIMVDSPYSNIMS